MNIHGGVFLKNILLFLVITCSAAPSAWAVNKCTGPDGAVVFQDAPCTGKGQTLTIRPGSGHSGAGAAESAARTQGEIAAINRRSETSAAITRGVPLIGMTLDELDRAMGAPSRHNPANYGGVQHDQLIYDRGGRTWYVYTEAGIVRSIQNSERIGAAPQSVRCPSSLEIRAMETSASSIALSDRERVERLRQIGDAKKCGR